MKIAIIAIIVIAAVAVVVYLRGKMASLKSAQTKTAPDFLAGIDVNIKPAIIERELSFGSDVVVLFNFLNLDPKKDTPFRINGNKLQQNVKMSVAVGGPSLFMGVYHEDSNTITDCKWIESLSYDKQTIEVLSHAQDGIVALS